MNNKILEWFEHNKNGCDYLAKYCGALQLVDN